jgi:hypothetical protein
MPSADHHQDCPRPLRPSRHGVAALRQILHAGSAADDAVDVPGGFAVVAGLPWDRGGTAVDRTVRSQVASGTTVRHEADPLTCGDTTNGYAG